MMQNNSTLTMLLLTGSILVIFAMSTLVYAQENATDSEDPKFFAIQHAQSGTISEINATNYTLELSDVSDKTILFSDRPDRIVTQMSTSDFIGNWTIGQVSFAADAPNAVLVQDKKEEQGNAIVELFTPIYDKEKRILKYDIISDNGTSIKIPTKFGESTLLIDPECISHKDLSCYG